jgi:hypothetical protein
MPLIVTINLAGVKACARHYLGLVRSRSLLLLATLSACVPSPQSSAGTAPSISPQSAECTLSSADRGWLASSIDAWEVTREETLRLTAEPLPLIILFDRRCAFEVRGGASLRVSGKLHRGSIQLPSDHSIGVRPFGMTSPASGDTSLFLALALASVWRTDPQYRAAAVNWEQYLTGAFIHEMTHSRMLRAMIPRLRQLAPALYPDSIRDDVVQDRFQGEALFASSVARETDLLYRAALTRSTPTRVDLARTALDMIRMRRARYYTGGLDSWFELEQAFLDLEGVAQWAAFSHARSTYYRRSSFADALERFRSGEQFWSQDEGLALFLALDALDSTWPQRFFGEPRMSSLELLARAVEGR